MKSTDELVAKVNVIFKEFRAYVDAKDTLKARRRALLPDEIEPQNLGTVSVTVDVDRLTNLTLEQNIQRLLDAEKEFPNEKNVEVIRNYIKYLETSVEGLKKIIEDYRNRVNQIGE